MASISTRNSVSRATAFIFAAGLLPSALATPSDVRTGNAPLALSSARPPTVSSTRIPTSLQTPVAFRSGATGFVENVGQADSSACFYMQKGNRTVWVTQRGLVFDIERRISNTDESPSIHRPNIPNRTAWDSAEQLAVMQDFVSASRDIRVEGRKALPGYHNYFLGNDASKWRTGVRHYSEIVYHDVWPGIDFMVFPNAGGIEQEFVVKPGADVSRIQVAYRGITGLNIAEDGSLMIRTSFGVLRESPPEIYQVVDGLRTRVSGRFKLIGESAYAFEIETYQPQYALVIDPTLAYSTFLGGNHVERSQTLGGLHSAIAVDAAGNVYVTGETRSLNFPTTPGAAIAPADLGNVFLSKLNPAGAELVYSTVLGGTGTDTARSIAVDSLGHAYIGGQTSSPNFPTTPGAFQRQRLGANDAFVAKLDPTGTTLMYSTLLGGTDNQGQGGTELVYGISVDQAGNAYVTGFTGSRDFPITVGAAQTVLPGGDVFQFAAQDAFVTKINPTGTGLIYSTFFGGFWEEVAYGIAVDDRGGAWIGGASRSADMPTTPGAVSRVRQGGVNGWDGFVVKISPDGATFEYASYFGGGGDGGGVRGVAVDRDGNVHVAGAGGGSMRSTPGAICQFPCGNGAYIAKLLATTELGYFAFLGAGNESVALGIAVNQAREVYVAGITNSTQMPIKDAIQSTRGGGSDAFVMKINPFATEFMYSTYLGGSDEDFGERIALDGSDNAYVVGQTRSLNFPTTPFGFQRIYGGGDSDAFLVKIAEVRQIDLTLASVNPKLGGDSGVVTANIGGTGLINGAVIKLSRAGQPDIVGQRSSIVAGGNFATTTFDLRGAIPGPWDVVVTNPDGRTAVLTNGFDVERGRSPDLWISIIGRPQVRVGGKERYWIAYGNRSNIDAFDVLAIINLPADLTFRVELARPNVSNIDWTRSPVGSVVGSRRNVPVWIYSIPASSSGVFSVLVDMPTVQGELTINANLRNSVPTLFAQTGDPTSVANSAVFTFLTISYRSAALLHPQASPDVNFRSALPQWLAQYTKPGQAVPYCHLNIAAAMGLGGVPASETNMGMLCDPLAPTSPNEPAYGNFCGKGNLGMDKDGLDGLDHACKQHDDRYDKIHCGGLQDVINQSCQQPQQRNADLVLCAEAKQFDPSTTYLLRTPVPLPGYGAATVAYAEFVRQFVMHLFCEPNEPPPPPSPPTNPNYQVLTSQSTANVSLVGSMDPNDKFGLRGAGSERYITGEQPLVYGVLFENLKTASAPAQKVVITDQLDVTRFDLDTLALGPIAFGATTVAVPNGVSTFSTNVALLNLMVRIEAGLDRQSGTLTWTFTSIDPSTGNPTTDPLAGFLPPNVNSPEGQGAVFFSVRPKSGLPSGEQLRNRASIVFDTNAAIETGQWVNTLDTAAPVSAVFAMPAKQFKSTFPITWSGTDANSGIQDYSIFVSEDGGPFVPYLMNTLSTSTLFTAQPGKSYAFFSMARDRAGNIERKEHAAEAFTLVASDNAAPSTTETLSAPANASGWHRASVDISLFAIDDTGGSGVKEIIFSVSGAQMSSGVAVGSNATVTIAAEGISTLRYFARDNAGNEEAAKTLNIKIDKSAPMLTGLPVANCALWPPNHQLVEVARVTATDSLSGLAPGSLAISATSSEGTAADVLIDGSSVRVRAERSGKGNGRVYTIQATAKDLAGNQASAIGTCTVPHDQRR